MEIKAVDIKIIRKKLELTQLELANKIGVSVGTIVNWENGKQIPNSKQPMLRDLVNVVPGPVKNDSIEDILYQRLSQQINAQFELINERLEEMENKQVSIRKDFHMMFEKILLIEKGVKGKLKGRNLDSTA